METARRDEATFEKRFTLDGSTELERRIQEICQQVLQEIQSIIPPKELEALMLAGGYGRGEGGVLKSSLGDDLYNDLEFYVCLRGNRFIGRHRYGHRLADLAEELSSEVGIEVEFKIISLAQLRRSPPSMFYYDLVMGHRWLQGDESLLRGCEHHYEAPDIPLSEATRLLMNRFTGLLLSGERLSSAAFNPDDSDFVARNFAKAQLAFGDALLTAVGQYHWSCRERHDRLLPVLEAQGVPWLFEVLPHHKDGMDFKLHPRRSPASASELSQQARSLLALSREIWLWLESQRLGRTFSSAQDYSLSLADKCPETNSWRNRLVNASVFGPTVCVSRQAGRHPRERLLNALPLLLWDDSSRDPAALHCLQQNLMTRSLTRPDQLERYLKLWERVR
jgi:hypothetical protein